LRRIGIFIFALITWYLIAWPYDFHSRTFDLPLLIAGAAASFMAALLLGPVFLPHKHTHNVFYRILWGCLYVPYLFYHILLANLDVLYRIVHPKRPINPGIVKVKTSLKSVTARTALANSITLTPGTLTVDMKDDGILYIHCINLKETDIDTVTKRIVVPFEKILAKVFE
jgi:multicomponent Na+:H+ antiporter subunit E